VGFKMIVVKGCGILERREGGGLEKKVVKGVGWIVFSYHSQGRASSVCFVNGKVDGSSHRSRLLGRLQLKGRRIIASFECIKWWTPRRSQDEFG